MRELYVRSESLLLECNHVLNAGVATNALPGTLRQLGDKLAGNFHALQEAIIRAAFSFIDAGPQEICNRWRPDALQAESAPQQVGQPTHRFVSRLHFDNGVAPTRGGLEPPIFVEDSWNKYRLSWLGGFVVLRRWSVIRD